MRLAFTLFASLLALPTLVHAQTSKPPIDKGTVLLEVPAQGKTLRITLGQMMSSLHVPGVSVAVIDDYRITWAGGIGTTREQGGTPITTETPFQAASISKPVTAAGALWLVSQGKLDLDQDVNERLVQWKVPANDLTKTQKVTLRRLLSHNAGVNVHGFAGYEAGKPMPTLRQMLDGEAPSNSPAIRVTATPGTLCRYSGGGFVIARALMEDVSKQPFDEFMQQHVLTPAGMKHSTFRMELSPADAARAPTGTSVAGKSLPGQYHRYPEMAPDSLWTTPSDLALFAIEIARSAQGKSNHVLPQAMVQEMLKPQCEGDGDRIGLGFGLRWEQTRGTFAHNGGNDGFQSTLMMDANTGKGLAVMGNGDGFSGIGEAVMRVIGERYGWHATFRDPDLGDIVLVIAGVKDLDAALGVYRQAKASGFKGYRHGPGTLNTLGYQQLMRKDTASAIRVFAMNVAEFPKDANAYDSLGEAYMAAGQRKMAIQNYEKSLTLNPDNSNAQEQLKTLRKGSQND